jgi:hypothetical protein
MISGAWDYETKLPSCTILTGSVESVEEERRMQLTDFARKIPDEVWRLFEPILPPVIGCGNGGRPYDNRQCLHALLYVLVTGIG